MNTTNNAASNTTTNNTNKTFITIPYYGKHSQQYADKINNLLRQNNIENIQIAFRMTKTKMYFNQKDKTHKTLKNNIIYKFTCCGDHNNTYIGKTERRLITRITEHFNTNNKQSAIAEHIKNCTQCSNQKDMEQFKIIDIAHDNTELSIKEALHIT